MSRGGTLRSHCWTIGAVYFLILAPMRLHAQSQSPRELMQRSQTAQFESDGDIGEVSLRAADGTVRPVRTVATVSDALNILADLRLAAAWPALLVWAGDDLHLLAEMALARTERAMGPKPRPQPVVGREKIANWPKKLLAFNQRVEALREAGRLNEAIALTESELAAPSFTNQIMIYRGMAIAQLQSSLAELYDHAGSTDRAIALLQAASAASHSKGPRENINANLAWMLASTGRYQEALNLDNATELEFDRSMSGILAGHTKLPDSHAYFTAIRACALNGLNRHDEASAALATIAPDPAAADEASARSQARIMAYGCMRNSEGLAAELAAQLAHAAPGSSLLLALQPALQSNAIDHATVAKAVASDTLIRAMTGRARVLGTPFAAVMEGWHGQTAATSTALKQDP